MSGWTKMCAALALVTMLLAAGVRVSQAQNPPATRLAVVNMVDLFDKLDAKKDADEAVQKLADDLEKQANAKKEEVQQLQDELKQYKEGSDIYNQTQNKLMTKALEYQSFVQGYVPQKRMMEMRIRTATLYRQINQAIAAYARSNGIALVLVTDNADLSDAKTREDLVAKISVRKVVYADPSLDITSAIVEKMNSEYKLGGAK